MVTVRETRDAIRRGTSEGMVSVWSARIVCTVLVDTTGSVETTSIAQASCSPYHGTSRTMSVNRHSSVASAFHRYLTTTSPPDWHRLLTWQPNPCRFFRDSYAELPDMTCSISKQTALFVLSKYQPASSIFCWYHDNHLPLYPDR